MDTKVCAKCDLTKAMSEFSTQKIAKDGKQAKCKSCCALYFQDNKQRASRYQRKTLYGVSSEHYEQLLKAQNRRCMVCAKEFTSTPHVDHCHEGGHVRGLLCRPCNTGLGMFKDNPSILRMAAAYLEYDNAKQADKEQEQSSTTAGL